MTRRWALVACLAAALVPSADSFGAQLRPPWDDRYHGGRRPYMARRRRRRRKQMGPVFEEEMKRQQRPTRVFAQPNYSNGPSGPEEEDDEEETAVYANSTIPSVLATSTTSSKQPEALTERQLDRMVNGAPYEAAPTVANSLGALIPLTRPANFPGVALFHMVGVYLALAHVGKQEMYWSVLLTRPSMWVTLAALLLTSSTSMVVNDYYDAKLGRDVDKHKALVEGRVSLAVARRFLSYLYAAALVAVAFLPGIPARLSVVIGLMMTYWYTQHLKPITLLKNIVCASLIALSPLTSGSAAMALTLGNAWTLRHLLVTPLWRLVGTLFFGVLAREILMDCNDVVGDGQAHVRTVPVRYGKRLAGRLAFLMTLLGAACSLGGPVAQVNQNWVSGATLWTSLPSTVAASPSAARRLVFAGLGSFMVVRRGWQVVQTEANDREVIDKAVNEGLFTVLFFLASFVA